MTNAELDMVRGQICASLDSISTYYKYNSPNGRVQIYGSFGRRWGTYTDKEVPDLSTYLLDANKPKALEIKPNPRGKIDIDIAASEISWSDLSSLARAIMSENSMIEIDPHLMEGRMVNERYRAYIKSSLQPDEYKGDELVFSPVDVKGFHALGLLSVASTLGYTWALCAPRLEKDFIPMFRLSGEVSKGNIFAHQDEVEQMERYKTRFLHSIHLLKSVRRGVYPALYNLTIRKWRMRRGSWPVEKTNSESVQEIYF